MGGEAFREGKKNGGCLRVREEKGSKTRMSTRRKRLEDREEIGLKTEKKIEEAFSLRKKRKARQ